MRQFLRSRRQFAAATLILAAAGAFPAAGQQAEPLRGYRIGPKDMLEIRVFEEPDLNVDRRVSEDGAVTLPLLGDFLVEGLTEDQAAQRLQEALEADYLQRATVSIEVTEFRSRPISVIGAVNKPGYLHMSERWTLFQAITEAGGLNDNHGDVIHVLRRSENGLSDRLAINVRELLVEGDARVNVPIFSNDVINVPSAEEITVLLLGEVAQPGEVTFRSTQPITLLGAIAKAGGLTERAADKLTLRRRDDDGGTNETTISYKALFSGSVEDPLLQAGDLIMVKESFF